MVWADFQKETAIKVADELIANNRLMYPWIKEKYADIPSAVCPEASQFFYVHNDGMASKMKISMHQQYDMEGDMKKMPGAQKGLEDFQNEVMGALGSGSASVCDKNPEQQAKEKELSATEGQLTILKTTHQIEHFMSRSSSSVSTLLNHEYNSNQIGMSSVSSTGSLGSWSN